jgi:hypothetical protein
MTEPPTDRATLVAISALAYLLAVGLHEHLGHASTCVLLGSHVVEMGAFFIDCDDASLSAASVRAVAIAGPAVSLLTGVVCLTALRWLPPRAMRAFYCLWLLGTLGFMSAAGYPLFSGVTGLGDLGTGSDGALRGAQPQWLWRTLLAVIGLLAYWSVAIWSARLLGRRLAGGGEPRLRRANRITRVSYFTGGVVYLAIGVFNPHGLPIMFESVLPASLGGTSGLLWMMDTLRGQPPGTGPDLTLSRSLGWIVIAAVIVAAYALVFAAR